MHDSLNSTLLYLGIILLAAICAMLINKLKQPAVLGQILIGSALAVLAHYKISFFPDLIHNETLGFLAELGSIMLLFEIGLESSIDEIKHAGKNAIIVAITGVVVPFTLGYYILAPLTSPTPSVNLSLFMGSMLAVTSTGISVSVFKDMGILRQKAAQIVLAASILDDIAGLILLSIISGLITVGHIDLIQMMLTLLYITLFFSISIIIGKWILPFIIKNLLSKISLNTDMLILSLITICMFFSIVASSIGLATIIGAFIAGLIIDKQAFARYPNKHEHLANHITPIGKFLIPVFFIYAGMQVDIIAAMNIATIKLAAIISIFAVASKSVCGIFLPKQINKWLIGFGMVPRGEIGIIFALTGLKFKLIDNDLFTALLLMVVITSVITPIMLDYFNRTKI